MSIITSLGYLSLLAAPVAAFWRLPCKSTLVVERADPIVAPGNVSGHVHQIMGGNGFDFEMDFADTQASTCTSCTVHGDFSNYWTPVLYYQHQDGTFEKVKQVGGGLVYYLQRTGPNNDKLQAFPEGLRMISGDPFKRSAGDDFASQAVSYACLDYSKDATPETPGFPSVNCPDGLRSQVFFPSCWDGVNLDSSDHKSHMAFPIDSYNNGACPDTHPVHLVSIFFEIMWDVNSFKDMWYGSSQPFVWAQGDPTGYGFHGDFLMGWDRDILQRAVDECTNDSGRVEDCPVFQLYPDSTAEGCKQATKIDEDIQGPFAQLPGCNPVQNGPGRASAVTNCASNSTIGEGKSFFTDLTSSGWGYQGCGTDNYYARALTGASTSQDSMTNEQCVKFCGDKGFSVAGTEYGRECYCGNSISSAAAPVAGVPGNCNMPCVGDSTGAELCGGYGLMSLYQKCTGSTCSNAADTGSSKSASGSSSAAGSSGRASASASASLSTSATPSTSAASSSNSPSVSLANTSTGNAVANVQSSTPSTASSASASTRQTTSSSSSSSSTPTNPTTGLTPNWSYLTCITDNINPRTLVKLAPYTLANALVTSTSCVSYCASAGYILAGTEYGGECWCGASMPSNTPQIDESECSMPCKGDSSEKCGGASALSLFADTSAMNGMWSTWAKREEQGAKVASWVKRDVGVGVGEVKEHMKMHARRFGHGHGQA